MTESWGTWHVWGEAKCRKISCWKTWRKETTWRCEYIYMEE